jgi:hypothetical protein
VQKDFPRFMQDQPFRFPAYRSADWLKDLVDSLYVHPRVLFGVDITPEYMANNSTAALYRNRADAAREQIRRALFRHALFKIQNIEVTFDCRDDRILESVDKVDRSVIRDTWDRLMNPESQKLLSEELWTIDRCEKKRKYLVRYYREGDDGFSTRVVPRSLVDGIGMFRFYFNS